MGCGNQKTRQGDCDIKPFFSYFFIFSWKPKDPPRGLRLSINSFAVLPSGKGGNQKTRQGDCDGKSVYISSIAFNIFSGNQKTRQGDCDSVAVIVIVLLFIFCGNQKTRQGDCDNIRQ